MDYFKGTKIQISPCIAAKAKFALHLTMKKPINTKTCSYAYWCSAIDYFSIKNNLTNNNAEEAKNRFKTLIK